MARLTVRTSRGLALTLFPLLLCATAEAAGVHPTPTPPRPPRPQRTGDLGDHYVRVYVHEAGEEGAPIAGAVVEYSAPSDGDWGVCYTDANGECVAKVFLHDASDVFIGVSTPAYRHASGFFNGLALYFEHVEPRFALERRQLRKVSGRVAADPSCEGSVAGARVVLEPHGPSTTTAADGTFTFDDVLDGTYRVRLDPDCAPVPCYGRGYVEVDGSDATVELCPQTCDWDAMRLAPPEGPASTTVQVVGRCAAISPDSGGTLTLDDAAILAPIHADTAGNYAVEVVLPPNLERGPHRIAMKASPANASANTATFIATSEPRGCLGDCDSDGMVSIEEVRCAVEGALGLAAPEGCARFDSDGDGRATIQELVVVVRRALGTCPPA